MSTKGSNNIWLTKHQHFTVTDDNTIKQYFAVYCGQSDTVIKALGSLFRPPGRYLDILSRHVPHDSEMLQITHFMIIALSIEW